MSSREIETALQLNPNHTDVRARLGYELLRLGEYERGWVEHEWRWSIRGEERYAVAALSSLKRPQWRGEPINGRSILLHAEQGYGDTIQFARYVPMVVSLGAKVTLAVQPQLVTLCAGIGAQLVVGPTEAGPQFDWQCPLMSLPLAFKTTLGTIPAQLPYLLPDRNRLRLWRNRLPKPKWGATQRVRRIGLAWAGNPAQENDRNRSIALSQLAPLLTKAPIISLQRDLRPGDASILCAHGIQHVGDQLEDFTDTAAVIALLDLIITVDTSVAHLAGALGKPVWILLSDMADWRWLLHREDSPWYPTARLFRQRTPGDWASVVRQIMDTLRTSSRPG